MVISEILDCYQQSSNDIVAHYFNIKLQMCIFFVLFTTLFSFISASSFDCLLTLRGDGVFGTGSIVNVNGVPYCLTAAHCVYDNNGSIYPPLKVYRHHDGQETSITAVGDFVCEGNIVKKVNQNKWMPSDLQRVYPFFCHLSGGNSPKKAWELSAKCPNVDNGVTLIRLDAEKVGNGKFPTLMTDKQLGEIKNNPAVSLHALVTFSGFLKGSSNIYYQTEEIDCNAYQLECGDNTSLSKNNDQLLLRPMFVGGNSGSPITVKQGGESLSLGVVSAVSSCSYDNLKKVFKSNLALLAVYTVGYVFAQEYEYTKLAVFCCLGFAYNAYSLSRCAWYLFGIPTSTSGILFLAYGSGATEEKFQLP